MLLINPTKSTLLLILNRGEVGPKNPRQTSCIWFNRQLILLQSSPIKLSSQSLSPKLSEPNSIKKPNPLTPRKLILSCNWNYSCGSLWRPFTTANSGLEILDFLCTQTIQRLRGESLVDSEVESFCTCNLCSGI